MPVCACPSGRARRKSTIKLWNKISTREDKKWTKKYHDQNPKKKCFGGKVIVKMNDGSIISEQINVADAHPSGRRPFRREQYIEKFKSLTDGLISNEETKRFLNFAQNLRSLKPVDLKGLNIEIKSKFRAPRVKKKTIFL